MPFVTESGAAPGIVACNIHAGGGTRVDGIAAQLARFASDALVSPGYDRPRAA